MSIMNKIIVLLLLKLTLVPGTTTQGTTETTSVTTRPTGMNICNKYVTSFLS